MRYRRQSRTKGDRSSQVSADLKCHHEGNNYASITTPLIMVPLYTHDEICACWDRVKWLHNIVSGKHPLIVPPQGGKIPTCWLNRWSVSKEERATPGLWYCQSCWGGMRWSRLSRSVQSWRSFLGRRWNVFKITWTSLVALTQLSLTWMNVLESNRFPLWRQTGTIVRRTLRFGIPESLEFSIFRR